jgi:hypothetical protein
MKGGICHAFRHLGFQIKIMLLLSLFVMLKFYLYQSLVYAFHLISFT